MRVLRVAACPSVVKRIVFFRSENRVDQQGEHLRGNKSYLQTAKGRDDEWVRQMIGRLQGAYDLSDSYRGGFQS